MISRLGCEPGVCIMVSMNLDVDGSRHSCTYCQFCDYLVGNMKVREVLFSYRICKCLAHRMRRCAVDEVVGLSY